MYWNLFKLWGENITYKVDDLLRSIVVYLTPRLNFRRSHDVIEMRYRVTVWNSGYLPPPPPPLTPYSSPNSVIWLAHYSVNPLSDSALPLTRVVALSPSRELTNRLKRFKKSTRANSRSSANGYSKSRKCMVKSRLFRMVLDFARGC